MERYGPKLRRSILLHLGLATFRFASGINREPLISMISRKHNWLISHQQLLNCAFSFYVSGICYTTFVFFVFMIGWKLLSEALGWIPIFCCHFWNFPKFRQRMYFPPLFYFEMLFEIKEHPHSFLTILIFTYFTIWEIQHFENMGSTSAQISNMMVGRPKTLFNLDRLK